MKKKFDTIGFIERARQIHGQLFCYDSTIYVHYEQKVKIKCKKHDSIFEILPSSHIKGGKCPKCNIEKRKDINSSDTNEFIEKSQKIHGDSYDYSMVEYVHCGQNIKIKCNKHNYIFEQTPSTHLKGSGCPKCGVEKISEANRNTTEYFIKKSKDIHADSYDYKLVEYTTSINNVKLICKRCNLEFLQSPNTHLGGGGCPSCAIKESTIKKRSTQSSFIESAMKIHHGKYDYTNTKYLKRHSKILIKCKKCDLTFKQTAGSHLQGNGCPKCAKKLNAEKTRLTLGTFINNAKIVHGLSYDYSSVDYTEYLAKIKILCKKCDKFFEQTPANHLQGHGCTNCLESRGEKKINNFLTLHNITFIRQKKFKDCKNVKVLPFDFYIPHLNLLIEFQGVQHYKSVSRFGGEVAFAQRQINDQIKRDFAKSNGIQLLEISYLEFDSIDQILSKVLNL